MIIHTVAFKTRHAIGSEEEKEFLRAGIALGKLPMVTNFKCYKQVSQKNDFQYGFFMEFASQDAYDAYNGHPDHVQFVETRWKPEVEDFLEIDYVDHDMT